MMRRHRPLLFLGALLVGLSGPGFSVAEADMPLAELLRSTHVHGLAVDQADPSRLLVATHHGLYAVALETGIATQVSERQDDFMGFTAHPSDPRLLYASGHPAGGGNLGFIASADGGRSWTVRSPGVGGPVDFHQMDVSKADPATIYGVYRGLQASRDDGRSWELVGPAPEGIIDLAASSQDPATLYAATQTGLLVSRDGGATWGPAHGLRRPVSLVETTAGGTIYAFVVGAGLLQAEEASLGWRTVSNAFGDRILLHLAVDPHESARLFGSTHHGELMASTDGGASWTLLAAP